MSLNTQLLQLETVGLIALSPAQPDLTYLFRHVLVQEATRSSLLAGLDDARAMNARRPWWPLLMTLSEVEAQRGQPRAAQQLRQQARQVVEYMLARTPATLRPGFLALPAIQNALQSWP